MQPKVPLDVSKAPGKDGSGKVRPFFGSEGDQTDFWFSASFHYITLQVHNVRYPIHLRERGPNGFSGRDSG
jgi:hypothetical protein